jgi:hypothetical protein
VRDDLLDEAVEEGDREDDNVFLGDADCDADRQLVLDALVHLVATEVEERDIDTIADLVEIVVRVLIALRVDVALIDSLASADFEALSVGIIGYAIFRMQPYPSSATNVSPKKLETTPAGLENVEFHPKLSTRVWFVPLPAIVATKPRRVTARTRLFPVSAMINDPSMSDSAMPCG